MYDLLRGHVERAHERSRRVYSLPAQARRRRAVSDVPVGSLVFAHLHKPVVEDEEESDRWRSKLTPCILVEVTMGPAGIWERCYGVVPLFMFTGSNRPSVVHVRRSIDIDFPEIVSYPLRLMARVAAKDIQDDVVFADGAWNENACVFEQKDPLDAVLALDADDAAPHDKVMKEAEAAAVEGEEVDFPEVDADRKDEATLRDAVAEEVLAPAVGAPPTGWRVDRFPQGSARMRLVSTPPWSFRPPTCEPELWLIIGKPAQRETRAKWHSDDPDAFAAKEERRSSWRRAKRGGVVACGVVAGGGELPGTGSAGDGHACLPRALAVRAIHDDAAVSSDGGLLAQRARRRDSCVETLVQQARALIMSGTHGHVFLELCCASDSELAAAVVEYSVVIRVTSSEDLQLASTRRALHRLLRICKAYDVVVDIWVSIPCTAGTSFRRINEKLGAETGDFAMTYKLVVAAVGLCRHAVRIGGGFSWEWSNGDELWDLVVVRNLFTRCGSSSCLVSTAAVGQQFCRSRGERVPCQEEVENRDNAAQAH